MHQNIFWTCTQHLSTSTEPTEPKWFRTLEKEFISFIAIYAFNICEIVTSSGVGGSMMGSPSTVIGTIWQLWEILIKVFEYYIRDITSGIVDFFITNNIKHIRVHLKWEIFTSSCYHHHLYSCPITSIHIAGITIYAGWSGQS